MRRTLITLCLVSFYLSNYAQLTIQWSVKHRPLNNIQNSSYLVNDQLYLDKQNNIVGGWLLGGTSYPNYAMGVTKYDASGNFLWEHDYAGSWGGGNTCNTVSLDDSDNVYLSGQVNSSSIAQSDVTLRYDSNGNLQWKTGDDSVSNLSLGMMFLNNQLHSLSRIDYLRNYNINGQILDSVNVDSIYFDTITWQGYGNGNSYLRADKENFYALGVWNVAFSNDLKYYIVKVDSSYNRLWTKIINPSNAYDEPVEMAVDENKNIYITGNVSVTTPPRSVFTCALNSNGDTLWTRRFNPNIYDKWVSDIEVDNHGHVYVSARFDNPVTTRLNVAVIQYDAVTGNQNWVQTFDSSYNTIQHKNSKLIVDSLGYIYLAYGMMFNSSAGVSINKLDSTGTILWHTSFDTLEDVEGFVYDGMGNFYVAGGKLTKFSLVTALEENASTVSPLSIYPNPASQTITLSCAVKNATLTLYDITGRALLQMPFNGRVSIDMSKYLSGVYIATVKDNSGVSRGRSWQGRIMKE